MPCLCFQCDQPGCSSRVSRRYARNSLIPAKRARIDQSGTVSTSIAEMFRNANAARFRSYLRLSRELSLLARLFDLALPIAKAVKGAPARGSPAPQSLPPRFVHQLRECPNGTHPR